MTTPSKDERLKGLLAQLREKHGVLGCGVVSRDGSLLAGDFLHQIDTELFATMSAAIQSAAETQLDELDQGNPQYIVIRSSKSNLILSGIGSLAISAVLASGDADMQSVLHLINETNTLVYGILSE